MSSPLLMVTEKSTLLFKFCTPLPAQVLYSTTSTNTWSLENNPKSVTFGCLKERHRVNITRTPWTVTTLFRKLRKSREPKSNSKIRMSHIYCNHTSNSYSEKKFQGGHVFLNWMWFCVTLSLLFIIADKTRSMVGGRYKVSVL